MSDERLLHRIGRKLAAGMLPLKHSENVAATRGLSDVCSGCDERIVPAQVAFEMASDGQIYRFHIGCHALWHVEVLRQARHARHLGGETERPG